MFNKKNKVVQDPNSVGSALRTISLRLRGTSVKVLGELGEETDGVVESISKLQSKIKALTGVNILTESGSYKETYEILREIGQVWQDMNDVDQAALLELMAGKNRANTLAAILGNMEDLKGAYESALNSEGSALRENEAYLDSIQGKVDKFNNALQTMWMNWVSSDVVKGIVDIGTFFVDLAGKVDLVTIALSGLLTYLNLSSKSSLDFVSMLGIHDLKTNKWTFGKEGLSGWIAKLFTGAKSTKSVKNNIVENILGTPEDIENETKDFAESIQDNIGDFVTLDTTEIDAQIDYIQNKLITARESLEENSKIDWSKIEGEIPSKEERDAHLEYQRQQIKNLELELDNLQSKRNEIISSAATSTTSPAITQVQAETNAYQSMFSVLQEVKDIQLSIGDEQYASKTIDEIIKAAGNGQEALANYVTSLDATDTALGGTNLALKAYVASVDDGNYSLAGFQKFIQQHNAGLKQSGIAAKAAAVGHQLLNAAISIGISFLISAGISAITKYINKQKEMVESAQEAINTYEDAQKTLRSNKQTIDELAQSYAILSDGVDPLTNKNINLATDSYQEYLDVCNQIADIYPNLVTSFDSQGNAILSLKGNIDELIQAYKDAAQASRQEMIASGDDVFNAFKKTYDSDPSTTFGTTGYAQQLALAEKLQDLIAKGTQDEINAFFNNLNSGNIEINGQKYSNVEFDDLADSAGINDDFYKNGFIRKSNIDVESFQKQSTKLLSFIKSTTTKINTETNKVKTLMDAYLGENLNYAKFDDKTRTVVDQIISGLNADFINGFDNADDLWNWIETNVVNTFSDPKIGKSMSDSISNALNLQSQFENNDIILKDYQDGILSFVQTIKDSNLGEEVKRQILQMFDINFDRESSIGDEVDQMLNYVQSIVDKNAQSKVLELSYSDLKIINSDQFNIPSGTIFSWEALKQKIKEVKIAMTEDFTVSNFADYADSISALQENISAYQEALEKLESGSFTMSDFVKLIEKFPDLAKGVDTSSKSFKGLSTNLKKAIRSSPKSLIKDLKNLKQQLIDAGKSTDDIDNLINAMEELPVDTVQSLSDEYITLADAINGAKIAQNELKDAMSENPNEGFETRAEAMEYMKEALSRGEIGSESNVWNVAEQYGFTYDSAKSINENADALANFITVRNKWYAKDDDGNYSYEGTENFINAVEQAVAKSSELQKYMSWTYEDGVLSFDFDNANWDKIISYLRQTEELAGITSEEFYDLLMQIGQFHNINWQDSDDLLWYLNQLKDGTKSISENFDSAKNAIQSFLENNDISLSWLDEDIKIVDTDSFKKLPEEIQKVLTEYYDLKAKFEADPLGIKFQLDKNSSDKVTKESLETLSQLTTVLQDNGTGTVFIDYTHLKEAAKEAGYTEEAIDGIIDKIKEYNNVCGIERTADDPLGLIGLQENATMTEQYLTALQIKFESIQNADNTVSFKVETESLINALISQGWTAEGIQSYLTTLENSGTYSFTIDGAEVKLSTEDAQSKINQLIEDKQAMSNGETTQYTVTGPGEASVDHIKAVWDSISTPKSTSYSIYETTYKNTVDNGVGVNGTAHANGSWGAPKTETALTGELGPELLVRGNRWFTVGDDGAEFTQIKKGDIIFNHKQTEQLLKNGYVTGRGKAYAAGTAYVSGGSTHKKYSFDDTSGSERKGSSSSSSADDAKDQFEELFDWIEVRLEEINKQLDFRNARLENSVGFAKQNKVIDEMLELNEKLYDNLIAGANKYYEYAGTLLAKIPAQYRKAAQDGSIAIETFIGEVDEETYKAIQDFREWVQKGDDAVQQAEEVITEVSSLAKQAVDNIATDFGNKNSLRDSKIDQLDAYNALAETKYGAESEAIYQAIIKETNKNIKTLETQRDKMQAELDKQVKEGNIQKYSQDWYDAVNAIAEVDTEIINLTKDTYDYQDSINELHWDVFDNLLSRFEAISDEADNLIDILGEKDLVNKDTAEWTKEGITTLGLYAQKMEVAEMQAKKYKDEINYLNKNWKKLGYTEQEYVEKLEELKEGQYDAIKAYNDTKNAIIDLNKERVDAIKDGIQKEIDAYEELINKKKEELDADKDAHDWQKTVADKQKNIADIERKIAALSSDNSASARAQRAKLESELLEAKADLEETYYDRSITQQQNALDKELENFKESKDKEIEGWDQYLENTEQVVADSLSTIQTNTDVVYQTLKSMGKEYSLSIAESLTSPWKDGETAIQSFSEKFGLSMSSTVEELQRLAAEFKKVMDEIDGYGQKAVNQVNDNASKYQQANNPSKPKFDNPETVVKPVTPSGGGSSSPQSSHAGVVSGLSGYLQQGSTGSNVKTLQQALNDLGFNAGTVDGIFGYNTKQAVMRFQSSSKYGGAISADGIVGPNTKRKFKTAGYAKGTAGVKKNQLALIDELGEELQLVPDGNGRLAYLKKGTAVIPHDISENLMRLGQLNPQDILDRNRPTINAPHITNNETVINIEYGDVLHIENFNGDKPEDLSKIIDKAFDKHMKDLNQQIRRYTR